MDDIEVINILKQHRDKKTDGESHQRFYFSHLAHSWPGQNYMRKAKYKTLGNG